MTLKSLYHFSPRGGGGQQNFGINFADPPRFCAISEFNRRFLELILLTPPPRKMASLSSMPLNPKINLLTPPHGKWQA